MDNRPIGIFDSGLGGLTVLKAVSSLLPNEDIVYFGDSKRTPYGSKSKETITNFSRQDVSFLLSKEVKAIVIACNTASSNATEELTKEFLVPFIEVIKPGSLVGAQVTRNNKVGVIGTKATIESNAYLNNITNINNSISVFQKYCPLLVPLVEEGKLWWNHPITSAIITHYLTELIKQDIDTLVLGCTHYPLLLEVIKKVVGEKITIVNSAGEVAKAVYQTLEDSKLLNNQGKGTISLYTSDSVDKFIPLASEILNNNELFIQTVDIERY